MKKRNIFLIELFLISLLVISGCSIGESNYETFYNPTKKLCIDQCELNLIACSDSVRVLNENRNCQNEFDICFEKCDQLSGEAYE